RYPDPVRVVCVGRPVADLAADPAAAAWATHSIEFCGGTHLAETGEAGVFVILQEQALAAGVRRITAVTGPAASASVEATRQFEERLKAARTLEGDTLATEIETLAAAFDEIGLGVVAKQRLAGPVDELRAKLKSLRKAAQRSAQSDVVEQTRRIAAEATGPLIVATVDDADPESLRAALDVITAKHPEAAAMLLSADVEASKVAIIAVVPPPLIKQGLKAGDWVREAARVCGGGGGGRPDRAQAGGKDPSKIDDARKAAEAFAREACS
ncbi:MAG: hypothetical protein HKO59_10960, partial [Phycisphaerales bacterium]|nr:hypothetical protein [Phycisphaerales bacterium]